MFLRLTGPAGNNTWLAVGDWIYWQRSLKLNPCAPGLGHDWPDWLAGRPGVLATVLVWFHASHSRAMRSLPELRDWLDSSDLESRLAHATVTESAVEKRLSREQERLRKKKGVGKNGELHHSSRQAFRQVRRALAIVCALSGKRKRRKLARKTVDCDFLEQLTGDTDRLGLTAFWHLSDASVWGPIDSDWLLELIAQGHRADELQREFDDRLLQEKLASLRQLAYGASHEINNPLANISMRAQALQRNEKNGARLKSLRTIYDQAMRAHHMITDMMLFANPPAVNRQPTDVVNLVSDVIAETAARFPERDFRMTLVRPERSFPANLAPGQIAELIAALLQNPIDAFIQPGEVRVAIDWNRNGDVVIRVSDNGPGIDPDTARHMFDPFYSGREAGRGLGFGLSKAWTIARQHGGSLRCVSSEPGNTIFEATIPTRDSRDSDSMQDQPANHGSGCSFRNRNSQAQAS